MIKKIDFILPQAERFTQSGTITKWIAAGVKHAGIYTRLITPPQDKTKPEEFIKELLGTPPACTFCVNGILPDSQGNFLSDLLQIPHVAYVTDTPTIYYSLCNSQFTIVASIDMEFQNLFSEVKGGNTLFLPGAAPPLVDPVPFLEDRPIDILMIPHLIDPDKIKEDWEHNLPKKMASFIKEVATATLQEPKESFTSSFLKKWESFSKEEQEQFAPTRSLVLIHELEMYIRGTDQLELLKAFEGMHVHLLIPKGTIPTWQKLLHTHKAKFSFHEGLDFDTIFKKIRESKIVLNSSPQIKYGTDGLPFLALIGGSYVFSSANNWLKGRYGEQNGIYYYSLQEPKTTREKALQLLSQTKTMDQTILVGRNKVIQEDTWNSRAEELLATLPSYLTPLATRAPIAPRGA